MLKKETERLRLAKEERAAIAKANAARVPITVQVVRVPLIDATASIKWYA